MAVPTGVTREGERTARGVVLSRKHYAIESSQRALSRTGRKRKESKGMPTESAESESSGVRVGVVERPVAAILSQP